MKSLHGVILIALHLLVVELVPSAHAEIIPHVSQITQKLFPNKSFLESRENKESKIAPVSPSGGGTATSVNNDGSKKEEGKGVDGGSRKHVGEVTMTSNSPPTKGAFGVAASSSGRRGGLSHLDEEDLKTIAFVGRSNPFL
mmetsp:Transcript_35890/g.86638  ORF Transcript_35890/g.86638 Transcript_35890/m.86638 type:complete len:141 (+) Transcript_35890:262-684(+)|eukprot:CAMPEP_0181099528 /NCGR_PEP_ID=MMETSP1071-20121207/12707_1 /TAXON_ID=35127 /ORGANISM="Thalassiosira sp., Strain NH16" /LENGTH=140 /DNA_ID=CAMNT_0023182195 /DNA_START=178 /DNA_END=603 /DNA_ORIENTATION=-